MMTREVVRYLDDDHNLCPMKLDMERFGVFGVAPPLDFRGQIMSGYWSIYHVPTGMLLVSWAHTDRDSMIAEAIKLSGCQRHARVWTSNDPARLVASRRIAGTVAALQTRFMNDPNCELLGKVRDQSDA